MNRALAIAASCYLGSVRIGLLLVVLLGCESQPTPPFSLAFPIQERDRIDWLIGVDHDPVVQEPGLNQGICLNYLGRAVPDCYDEHTGTDYVLAGGFEAMDNGSAQVLAAADGVVIESHDGEYDRCHLVEGQIGVDCDGFPMRANLVAIEHEDGMVTRYLHLKRDSVNVSVGDVVACGDPLGSIGSSGFSSFPHLHFELSNLEEIVDPYAGPYSQERSWWTEQHPEGEMWPSSSCR